MANDHNLSGSNKTYTSATLWTSIIIAAVLFFFIGRAVGGSDGKEVNDDEDAYLAKVGSWMKKNNENNYPIDTDEYKRMIEELSDIEAPPGFRSRHRNLLTGHSLRLNVEEAMPFMESKEQLLWRAKGTDAIAACINLREDSFLGFYASGEFDFICRMDWITARNLIEIESEWEVSILNVYGADPYHVRN